MNKERGARPPLPFNTPKHLLRCANCGSSDVQILAWIDPNAPGDGRIIEWSDCQRGCCRWCEDEVYVDYKKENE